MNLNFFWSLAGSVFFLSGVTLIFSFYKTIYNSRGRLGTSLLGQKSFWSIFAGQTLFSLTDIKFSKNFHTLSLILCFATHLTMLSLLPLSGKYLLYIERIDLVLIFLFLLARCFFLLPTLIRQGRPRVQIEQPILSVFILLFISSYVGLLKGGSFYINEPTFHLVGFRSIGAFLCFTLLFFISPLFYIEKPERKSEVNLMSLCYQASRVCWFVFLIWVFLGNPHEFSVLYYLFSVSFLLILQSLIREELLQKNNKLHVEKLHTKIIPLLFVFCGIIWLEKVLWL